MIIWIRYARSAVLAAVFVLCVAGLGAVQSIAQDRYVEGFEDMPLMASLTGVPDANLAFDTKGGRIIVAFAEGEESEDNVRAFYSNVLPQFGWAEKSRGTFEREGESLLIDFPESQEQDHILVRYTLSPRAKSK